MDTLPVTIFFLGFLLLIAGAIVLQIYLSKKKNKWLGLILPLICLIFSLSMTVAISIYGNMTKGEIFSLISSNFLIANVPTIVLLGIYFGCREKIKRNKALEKMNIQDLE